MIATIVFFMVGVIWRCMAMVLNNPVPHIATAHVIDNNIVRLTIPTYTMTWQPGQHVFLSFLSVRPFESHPFSLACSPTSSSNVGGVFVREMDFVIRPHKGFTSDLLKYVDTHGDDKGRVDLRCIIDGPYGEGGHDFRSFNNVLLAVGGSGISWALGILQDLTSDMDDERVRPTVELVWAIRDASQSPIPHM